MSRMGGENTPPEMPEKSNAPVAQLDRATAYGLQSVAQNPAEKAGFFNSALTYSHLENPASGCQRVSRGFLGLRGRQAGRGRTGPFGTDDVKVLGPVAVAPVGGDAVFPALLREVLRSIGPFLDLSVSQKASRSGGNQAN